MYIGVNEKVVNYNLGEFKEIFYRDFGSGKLFFYFISFLRRFVYRDQNFVMKLYL